MVWIASSGPLAANAYGFNFVSIPQTFTHLQLRVTARGATGTAVEELMYSRPNNDTSTSNYRTHYLYGNGSSVFSGDYGTGRNYSLYQWIAGNGASSNVFGTIIIDVLDYANTNKNKTIRSIAGIDNNGSGDVSLTSNLWINTAAITSFEIGGFGVNLAAGSRIDLYGITTSQVTGA